LRLARAAGRQQQQGVSPAGAGYRQEPFQAGALACCYRKVHRPAPGHFGWWFSGSHARMRMSIPADKACRMRRLTGKRRTMPTLALRQTTLTSPSTVSTSQPPLHLMWQSARLVGVITARGSGAAHCSAAVSTHSTRRHNYCRRCRPTPSTTLYPNAGGRTQRCCPASGRPSRRTTLPWMVSPTGWQAVI
jgi:hypothetical protein